MVIGEFVPATIYKKLNNGCMVLVLVNHQLILRRLYITKNKLTLRADHKSVDDFIFELNGLKNYGEYVTCFTNASLNKIQLLTLKRS